MMSIIEFGMIICNLTNLLRYLREKKMLKSTYICQICGCECCIVGDISLSDGQIFQCTDQGCRKRYSIRIGSFFARSKLSLDKLTTIIYFFCASTRVSECVKFTKVSQRVVILWYNYCRDICTQYLSAHPVHFNCAVQLDETAVGGKRKYHRGFLRKKPNWVFGIVNNQATKCYFQFVPNRTGNTLIPIITQFVQQGNVIHSDEAPVYKQLGRLGYIHRTVCHKYEYVNSRNGVHTNTIESLWSIMKAKIKECRGSQGTMLHGRLDEFQYRFNRKNEGDMYDLFLIDVAALYAL